MMKLYLPEADQSDELRQNYFNYAPSSTYDVLGSTFSQTLYENPASSLFRSAELFFAGKQGKRLTSEEYAESEYYREGITVGPDGMHESTAQILAERFDTRAARKMQIARGQGGFAMAASQLGVGLVASMMDPLNIAAAFIPVVGQARYASMIARSGKTSARLKRGLTEGAVGAVAVEPIVYGTARYEQNIDYTMADTLLNITFGTVLGGGLHVGFGAVGDALGRAGPEVREAAQKAAVAQAVSNKEIDVNPIMQADSTVRNHPAFRGEQEVPDWVTERGEPAVVRKGTSIPKVLKASKEAPPKTLIEYIRSIGGIRADDINIADVRQNLDKISGVIRKKARKKRTKKGEPQQFYPEPKTLSEIAEAVSEAGYFGSPDGEGYLRVPTINELLDKIDDDARNKNVYPELFEADYEARRDLADSLREEAERYGINYVGMSDEDFMRLIEARREQFADLDKMPSGIKDGLTEQEFYELRESLRSDPDKTITEKEFEEEIARIDQALEAEDPDALGMIERQSEELIADINFLIEQGADPEDFAENLVVYENMAAKAGDGYDSALRQGAECLRGAV